METLNNNEILTDPTKEQIKLSKNSKGNYQWEIKVLADIEADDKLVERLDNLAKELERRFG